MGADLTLTLPTDDGEVQVVTALWVWPKDEGDREGFYVAVHAPEVLVGPAHEFRWDGLTAREGAVRAATPELRAAYGLLVQAIESMFRGYPRTASEQLEQALADSC